MNVYDTANQIERELRELPEYQALKEELNKVKADNEANNLFEEFKKRQKELQTKVMSGGAPTKDEQQALRDLASKVSANAVLSQMLQKEQAFGIIVEDVIKMVQAPLNEIYK